MILDYNEVAEWIEVHTRRVSPMQTGSLTFKLNEFQQTLLYEICKFDRIITVKERQVGASTLLMGFALYVSDVHKQGVAYYTHTPGNEGRRFRKINGHTSADTIDRIRFCQRIENISSWNISTVISDTHDIFSPNLAHDIPTTANCIGPNDIAKTIIVIDKIPEMVKGKYAADHYK